MAFEANVLTLDLAGFGRAWDWLFARFEQINGIRCHQFAWSEMMPFIGTKRPSSVEQQPCSPQTIDPWLTILIVVSGDYCSHAVQNSQM